MQDLIHEDTKCPNIRLWPVDVIYEALRRHVNWASNIDVLPFIPNVIRRLYRVRLANPKSAILATPLLNRMFAILKSLCTMDCSARYLSPWKVS